MTTNYSTSKSNWLSKFYLSFLAFVGGVNALLFVVLPILPYSLTKFINTAGMLSLLLALLFSIIFSLYWNYKEKNHSINSEKYKTVLIAILRFWIAFHVCIFGFEKIIDVNFSFSYRINDSLVNTLTGQELTWKYYGYSYGLSLIVAILQIAGGIALLFKRSILLGLVLLMPVMFNILLINLFYNIGPITCFTSIQIMLGLAYLLLQYKEEIISLFTSPKITSSIVKSKTLRVVTRVLCIIIPCLFVLYYSHQVQLSKRYFGKWKVESMSRNGKIILEKEWEKDSSAWKTIYIEERGKIFFCPNPNLYVDSASIFMKYRFDDVKNTFKVISYERNLQNPDTIPVQINNFDNKSMQWNMVLYKDTIRMQLKKLKQ
ncbi:hypothetical protein [Flavobacterium humidisoli]|uniref:DoxX family protein n=1 Tax=Flavobacterium humidisoli TaxID=2937442 RepID=A0ABY4LPU0_9FLAO|nr:hypothetical protein [Flavobacterium humidisoli]UPZ14249.1 hypothetical protein M0M44_15950 [Flavobacterium humidisoli]